MSFKSATWVNNDKVAPHPKAKLLNRIWKLNLIPNIKQSAWKLIKDGIPTRENLMKIELGIHRDCPFCGHHWDDINQLFSCPMIREL